MVRLLGGWLAVAWGAASSALACEATSEELALEVARHRSAYVEMDATAATQAHRAAGALVPCLVEVISTAEAASYHRMEALQSYLAKDDEAVVESFMASVELQPEFRLPTSIAPEGNRLAVRYAEAVARPPSPTVPVPVPPRSTLYVDGLQRRERPVARPVLLQLVDAEGAVSFSDYLTPEEGVPDWPGARLRERPPPPAERKLNRPLLATTGGLGAVSAALLTGALVSRAQWRGAVADLDEIRYSDEALTALERRTNTLGFAAQGAGIATLGLGVATVVVSW